MEHTFEAQQAALSFIIAMPLLGCLASYLVGRTYRDAAGWIATAASALAFVWVAKCFVALPETAYFEDRLFNWFSVGDLTIDFMLRFDRLTAVMALVVTGVGSLIHLYSIAYMHEDEGRHRFFAYLNLFMFSMLTLVLGGNALVLFVGWEGVGLCSYLLIGFWFKNAAFAAAGRKAFVVNRIGDAGFLLGIFLLYKNFGTLDFVALKTLAGGSISVALVTAITLCLFVGATGKSAQIPLFVWLPDAMAGPTPVSALIHAATMVTAGVYLLARLSFLFVQAPFTLFVVGCVAVATAFVAATTALCQNDIKKVLAYSTVSQLGFMFVAAASGAFWVAIFHVVTHAFFKACLFLCAGSVIHGCHHEQDMRHMGGLLKKMPITAATYGIATLAIAGIFPLAGYQSKHAILAALEGVNNPYFTQWVDFLFVVVSFTAFLTAFYMTRSFAMTFLGNYRGHAHPHESPWAMTVPLMVLAALSLGGGVYLVDRLPEYLAPVLNFHHHAHHESIFDAIRSSWIGILGVGLGLVFYTQLKNIPAAVFKSVPLLPQLFSGKYYLDEIYGAMVVRPLEGVAQGLFRYFDQGVIDGAVNGTAALVDVNGEIARQSQSGELRHYAIIIFGATTLLVLLYLVLGI